MPKYTPNLNIQLADPATDGNQTFNIDTMINNPVEKVDEALGLVPVSGDVRVATTGNIVLSGAQTIDGIALAAGNRVLVKNQTAGKENGIYTVATGAWTRAVDANSTAKLAAGISVYVEEGAANGKTRWQMANTGTVTLDTTAITFEKTGGAASATDTVIGSRTISDTTAPTGDSGTVTTLFGWLASMIKAITGGATWRTLPGMSIAAIKTVLDAATNLGTASTLMKRDASGRAQVAAPSAAADIARKDTVDGAITAHKAETDPHTGYVKKSGDTMTDALSVPALEVKSAAPLVVLTETDNSDKRWYMVADGGGLSFRENTLGAYYMSLNGGNVRIKNDTQILISATVSDLVYYVRTEGNDSNTGTANTAGGAFKTIGKAISMIPQVINHNVTVNVAPGTYNEEVRLAGFSGGGTLSILGASSIGTTHTVKTITVRECSPTPYIRGFNMIGPGWAGIAVESERAGVEFCRVVTKNINHGIYATNANVTVQQCELSVNDHALVAENKSTLYSWDNTGSGSWSAGSAGAGSYIGCRGTQPSGTNSQLVGHGSIIVPESGVINPWGDNTLSTRSRVDTYLSAAFTHGSANGFYKVPFATKYFDPLNEFSTTLSRFTAKQSGRYVVSASIGSGNVQSGCRYLLVVYLNGVKSYILGEGQGYLPPYLTVGGSCSIECSAGDYIEIYLYTSQSGLVVDTNGDTTYLLITKVA